MAVRSQTASSAIWGSLPESIKTGDYTVAAADIGTMLVANKATAITFSLPALASAGTGPYLVRNIGAGVLTLDPNSTEQIEGANTLAIATNEAAILWANGSLWRAAVIGNQTYAPLAGNKNLTGGFTSTPTNKGNITSFTVDGLLGQLQYGTNHGAFTLTAPAADTAVDLLVTNDASAGAITFSGFTVSASTGDALTTTNGNKFLISVRRINGVSTYMIKALQ